MNCEQIQDILLNDYLNKEISPEQKKVVDEHLHQCPTCMEFFNHATEVVLPMETAQKHSVPDDDWQNIKNRIETQKEKGTSIFHFPKPILPLAFAVIILISFFAAREFAETIKPPIVCVMEHEDAILYLTDEFEEFMGTDFENEEYFLEEFFL